MNIFVTGGTGFVGQVLVRTLLKKGHQVYCLVRNVDQAKEVLDKQVRLVQGDLCDEKPTYKDTLSSMDVAYHLAGSVFGKTRKELFRANVIGTENLFCALKNSLVKKFIFLSSLAAVGPLNRGEVITEETMPSPVSLYGESKLEAERRLKDLMQNIGKEVCVVRSPLIYGKGLSVESRLSLFVDKIRSGSFKFVGDGENTVSLCQIDNLVDFFIVALKFGTIKFEVFHIANPVSLTMRQLVETVSQHLGLKTPIAHIPISVAKAIGLFLDSIRRVVPIQTDITSERVCELAGNWKVDLTKARRWGYDPREDWMEQLLVTVDWHLQRRENS